LLRAGGKSYVRFSGSAGGTNITVGGGGSAYPPGVNFGFKYIPVPASFVELR
jgi:hypothetical protein